MACIIYFITKGNEEVITWFGFGIVGCLIYIVSIGYRGIKKVVKYHKVKSIILCPDGDLKWCECKDADDIYCWHTGYKLLKRYANKDEWSKCDGFSKEEITIFKRNCDNCLHNNKNCLDNFYGNMTNEWLCVKPKDQWEESWNPEIDQTYPKFEKK